MTEAKKRRWTLAAEVSLFLITLLLILAIWLPGLYTWHYKAPLPDPTPIGPRR